MPINDPIRDRKIAPNSLAFPVGGSAAGGASVTNNTTYQQNVTNTTTNIVVYADSDVQNRDRHALAAADRDAELRAKAWVSDWHRVIDWDITVDQDITNNAWDPLRFSNEAMRAMGAVSNAQQWSWTVAPGWEGTWFIYAFISANISLAAAVGAARLGIIVNGTLRTVIDRVDAEISGDDAALVRDCIMRGGRNISLAVGDVVQIAVYFGGAVGNATYLHPSSFVGYVSGFRTMCGFDHIVNSQDDIDGYTFA